MKTLVTLTIAAAAAMIPAAAAAQNEETGRRFVTQLTGAAERPGPGDPDGTGTASFRINAGQNRVCFELRVNAIEPATLAHIHRGAADVPGPIVVHLTPPTSGFSSGCVAAPRALILEILRNPSGFYANVHNAQFPPGAVRGQLSRSPN